MLEARVVLTSSWTSLAASGTAPPNGGAAMMLLSNGTVLVQDGLNSNGSYSNSIYNLSPQANTGSYVNGGWSGLQAMKETRLFFTTATLPDGKIFAVGGEYPSNSNTAEIYDPVANTWTYVDPSPNPQFGDDPIVVPSSGPNSGQVLAGYLNGAQTYRLTPRPPPGASGHRPSGASCMATRAMKNPGSSCPMAASCPTMSTAAQGGLFSAAVHPIHGHLGECQQPRFSGTEHPDVRVQGYELGPGFLQPDGNVIYFGANGNTAIYQPASDLWTAGPAEPQKNLTITANATQTHYIVTAGGPATFLAGTDDPGAMLPNGKILIALSPVGPLKSNGNYSFPEASYVYEYDYTSTQPFTEVTPGGINNVNAFQLNMVLLPTGQVLMSNEGNGFQVYTENTSTGPQDAWRPTISSITPNIDGSFRLTGTQLNGLSEGSTYGDDNESATNYPIVQLTDQSNNVTYARTSEWSSTGVATGTTPVWTTFQLPSSDGPGAYYLSVIANGIASTPVLVVFGTSGDDTVTVGTTDISYFQIPSVTVNGAPIFYTPGTIEGIHILAGGGNNTINVQQTYAGAPVSIEGSATDAVNIGSQAPSLGGTLANIAAPVNVSNTSGSTTLNVDDSGDTTAGTAHMGTLASNPGLGYLDGPTHALITYQYAQTAGVTIDTGSASGNVFGVWEDGVPTTLVGNGLTTVNVGDGYVGVQSILGTLTIENPPAFTTINIDDSSNTDVNTAHMGTIPVGDPAWGYITGLAPADIHYKYADTTSLTINTSSAEGDTFGVWEDGVPTTLNIDAGANIYAGDGNVGLAAIQAPLTVNGTVPDFVNLSLNDQADTTGRTVTMASGSVSVSGSAEIDYGQYALANLYVNGGSGTNTFNVLSTPAPEFVSGVGIVYTLTMIDASGADTVNVGDANGVQDIQGPLTVDSAVADFVNLNLNDQADTTGRTITMASGSVGGLAPADIDYGLYALANLNVNGGTAANTFNVLSTPVPEFVPLVGIVYTNTMINASGADTVNVGDAGGVQDVQGPLTVNSAVADFIDLNLNDQADKTGRTVTMASGSVSGLAPADIDYGLYALANLNVNGGTGANTFNVLSTPVPEFVPLVGIVYTNTTINSLAQDTVNVGDANGVQDIQGPFTVDSAKSNVVKLNLNDQADTTGRTVTLASGSVSGLAPVDIDYGLVTQVTLTLEGGAGVNTLVGPDVASTWNLTGSNSGTIGKVSFSGFTNLTGGTAADTFKFASGGVSGTIDGGGGVNTLDYSGNGGTAVSVNLASSTATKTGGFANIQKLVGGTGAGDKLIGPGTASTWSITAVNGGNVAGFGFSSIENLTGGSANDLFKPSNGMGVSGKIDGGGGTNTLDDSLYSTGVIVNLTTGAATGTGSIAAIQNVTGSPANDTITGSTGNNTISGNGGTDVLNGGGAGTDLFILGTTQGAATRVTGAGAVDTLQGANIANVWTISAVNSGDVNGIVFTGIANLTGGTSTDTFKITTGSVSGKIDGGSGTNTLDYSGDGAVAANVNLATSAASKTGGIANIEKLVGSTSTADTLIGPNVANTWTLSAANGGTVGTFTFSAMENLTGGTSTDTFKVTTGSVTGKIDGGAGTDTLDYSGDGAVAANVNLATSAATKTGGIANIEKLVGSTSTADTLIGPNVANTWTLSAANGGTVGTFTFSAVENLTGGTSTDTFKITTGSVTGKIDGGAGTDTLDYSGDGAVAANVNLATSAATKTGGIANIEKLVGSTSTADTLIGPNVANTWTLSAANGGTVGTFTFSAVENLTGGTSTDTFKITTGSVTGKIDGGAAPTRWTTRATAARPPPSTWRLRLPPRRAASPTSRSWSAAPPPPIP